MTEAEKVAKDSEESKIKSMLDVENAGGIWDGENFSFPDGSKGAFTKKAPMTKMQHQMQVFSHYRFEVVNE